MHNWTRMYLSLSKYHYQNIQKLGIEMFKVLNGESPKIVDEIFCIRYEASHELQQRSRFHTPSVNKYFQRCRKYKFLDLKIWEPIPKDIRWLEYLRDFKTAIKKWKTISCQSIICKTWLYDAGFLKQVSFNRVFYTF